MRQSWYLVLTLLDQLTKLSIRDQFREGEMVASTLMTPLILNLDRLKLFLNNTDQLDFLIKATVGWHFS